MTDEEKNKEKNEVLDEPEKSEKAEEKGNDSDSKSEEKPTLPEQEKISSEPEPSESTDEPESPPDTPTTEELMAENIRLKAQIEAYKAGFRSETLEDAVLLAENIAKRDGTGISEALQAVAEKYPDWKNTENNSGFKIGAEPPEESKPDESRLDNAFGIRKKKGL